MADRTARAANLQYFAAESDQCALLDYLFASSDVRVFESYSDFDADLREFQSTAEIAGCFAIGVVPADGSNAALLKLWSPSVVSDLKIHRLNFPADHANGHRFRHSIEGGGLIQLNLGGVCGQILTVSNVGHRSEVHARKWGINRGVDWKALQLLSHSIQQYLRKRLAVAMVPSRPVLPQAFAMAQAGFALKLTPQTKWAYPTPTQISRLP